jgi:uncharacterized protein
VKTSENPLQRRYEKALDALIDQVRADRTILAAILCGSLSHDTVWEKSDIDLMMVTLDGEKGETGGLSINADGINVHAFLMTRAEFRKTVEGTRRNSFAHTLLAKGRLLYTKDETIAALCERLREIGERDTRAQLLGAGCAAILPVDKARKWLVTRGDLDYCALWILYAANGLARIEVLLAREMTGREILPQALGLNPSFFGRIYTDMLNAKKTRKQVETALEAIDGYLEERTGELFGLLLEYLEEAGEARSCTEIEMHFKRNWNVEGVTAGCEYLADRGLIVKAEMPARLTRRSTVQVPELAFAYLGEPPDEF